MLPFPRAFLTEQTVVEFTLAVLPASGVFGWDFSAKAFAVRRNKLTYLRPSIPKLLKYSIVETYRVTAAH